MELAAWLFKVTISPRKGWIVLRTAPHSVRSIGSLRIKRFITSNSYDPIMQRSKYQTDELMGLSGGRISDTGLTCIAVLANPFNSNATTSSGCPRLYMCPSMSST